MYLLKFDGHMTYEILYEAMSKDIDLVHIIQVDIVSIRVYSLCTTYSLLNLITTKDTTQDSSLVSTQRERG